MSSSFFIYVNDIEASDSCKLISYADDAALLVSGEHIKNIDKPFGGQLVVSQQLADRHQVVSPPR